MRKSLMTLILAAALGLTWAAASTATGLEPARHQAVPTSIQAPTASQEAQDPGTTTEPGYAQREAQAKDLESFSGGHEVIVVSSCVVLLVLLLILI